MKTYDIVVVGGGFTGTCAAIAAARQGSRVLLVEKTNALGGAAVTCLVNPFMPYTTKENDKIRYLSRGIFEEIANELSGRVANDPTNPEKQVTTFDEELLKLILNRKCIDAGVELLFHAYLSRVDAKDGRVNGITVATVAGEIDLKAEYYIDATGDGTLSYLAGCPFHLGRPNDSLCQPMTLCFRLTGVDKPRALSSRRQICDAWKAEQALGHLKNPREDVLYFNTVHDGIIHMNTTRIVKLNPTDPFDVTRAELEVREQVYEVVAFLRKFAPGFENCRLLSTALDIGVRESRMIDGEHTLTAEELKDCTRFEDSVATGNYDIDIHNPEGSGTSHYYFKPGEYYTIPYRCLIPKGMKNLLVAGRCISATHEAQASIRIMPIVATLGEAAGTAAALANRDACAVGDIKIEELHRIFEQNNVSF